MKRGPSFGGPLFMLTKGTMSSLAQTDIYVVSLAVVKGDTDSIVVARHVALGLPVIDVLRAIHSIIVAARAFVGVDTLIYWSRRAIPPDGC